MREGGGRLAAPQQRRRHGHALQQVVVTKRCGVLCGRRGAERKGLSQRASDVAGQPPLATRAEADRTFSDGCIRNRSLEDAIDHAARGASAEERGCRSFHHLDPFDGGHVPVVRRIVAGAVQQRVVLRGEAANQKLIAAPFAKAGVHARHIPQRVAQRRRRLLLEHGRPDDVDRLRNLEQRRGGAGGGRGDRGRPHRRYHVDVLFDSRWRHPDRQRHRRLHVRFDGGSEAVHHDGNGERT